MVIGKVSLNVAAWSAECRDKVLAWIDAGDWSRAASAATEYARLGSFELRAHLSGMHSMHRPDREIMLCWLEVATAVSAAANAVAIAERLNMSDDEELQRALIEATTTAHAAVRNGSMGDMQGVSGDASFVLESVYKLRVAADNEVVL